MLAVPAAGAALAAGVLGCGGPSYMTVHGTVTATQLALTAGPGGVGNCVLSLPDDGSQITMSADGANVANATLPSGGFKTSTTSLGETCSTAFTIYSVPTGKSKYAVTINVSRNNGLGNNVGCSGTVYYTPAQLAKPLSLSCGS